MTDRERAERLFDDIGLIDDEIIYEASTPYVSKRSHGGLRRFMIIAVAATVALSVILGTLTAGLVAGGLYIFFGDRAPDKGDDVHGNGIYDGLNDSVGGNADHSQIGEVTLYARLDSVRNDHRAQTVSEEDLELFDGGVSVIWKYSDDPLYRVYRCSSEEKAQLVKGLSNKGDAHRVYGGEESNGVEGIWISLGDGRVITPCLELTEGNVGYGEIFEYEPEYEPDEDLSKLICDLVS